MMKRTLLIVALGILSLHCMSQEPREARIANIDILVIDLDEAIDENNGEIPYELWLTEKTSRGQIYYMFFKMTTVGYKHCLDKAKEIVKKNNMSFEKDRGTESILFPPYCDGYDDYHCIVAPLKRGDAEVVIGWVFDDNSGLVLRCDDESFTITMGKDGY